MAPRAVAYLCRSPAARGPDSSFEAQLDRISAWCNQAGVAIVEVVEEDTGGQFASTECRLSLSELFIRLNGDVAEILLFTRPTFPSVGERREITQSAVASGRWIDVHVDDENPAFDYHQRRREYEDHRRFIDATIASQLREKRIEPLISFASFATVYWPAAIIGLVVVIGLIVTLFD